MDQTDKDDLHEVLAQMADGVEPPEPEQVADPVELDVAAAPDLSIERAQAPPAEPTRSAPKVVFAIALLVVGGLLGWVFAGTLWVRSTQLIGPGRTAIIGSSAPLFSLPLSVIFLGERPGRRAVVGTLLTVAGIALVV